MKKLNGWVSPDNKRPNNGFIVCQNGHFDDVQCTVIIGTKKTAPVVFTAEDVEAKIAAERLRVQPLIEAGENARKVLVEELGDIEIGDNEIGPPDYGENAAAAMAMNEAIAMIDSALTAYQNTER